MLIDLSSLGITNKYLNALIILIAYIIIAKIFLVITEKVIHVFTKKTKTHLDDLIIEKTKNPIFWILIILGIDYSFEKLNLPFEKFDKIILDILVSIIILFITIIVARLADIFIDFWGKKWAEKTNSTLDDELLPIFHKASKVVLIFIGIVVILAYWGVDVTGLLAGAGVAGIIIGLAVKDSLANIFGGISLILDESIRAGDKVKLETGELGVIENIGLRSTQVRSYNNETFIIPNGKLSNMNIQNYARPNLNQRVNVKFSVAYGSKVEDVRALVLKLIKSEKSILKDPEPVVDFVEMGDSGLNMVARFWIDDFNNDYPMQISMTEKIYNALNKGGFEIPFPTRTVYLKKD